MTSAPHYQTARGVQLTFSDVKVTVDKKTILDDVSGLVKPREMLAVMGPSGSGKTTLLNCLAGRHLVDSGQILINNEVITKKQRRKICYVLQEDLFFANLTLKQTLTYSALLRLPEKMPYKEKIDRLNELVEALDLKKCLDTVIGSTIARGLSGGEKKRANIASELLTNPELILLDEPTSGLDSSTACSLMTTLKLFASSSNKTVVATIHQPSSQIFHMFDTVLLLSDGQPAYFGDAHRILDFFENIDLPCAAHYNPADFILEQVKDLQVKDRIIEAASQQRNSASWPVELRSAEVKGEGCQTEVASSDTRTEVAPLLQTNKVKGTFKTLPNGSSVYLSQLTKDKDNVKVISDSDSVTTTTTAMATVQAVCVNIDSSVHDIDEYSDPGDKWPTSFLTQYRVLTTRNFVQSRSRILSRLNLIQTIVLSIMCGLVWFQVEQTEANIREKEGFLFFTMVYWSFFPMFDGISAFPQERVVINKERLAGSYRLSAYYFAKMTSELPLIIILPTIFLTISYLMAGLNSFTSFMSTWSVLMANSLVSQSAGLLFGALTLDFTAALTCASIYGLGIMLIGGFYKENLPFWLNWGKYLSHITYSFSASLQFEFTGGEKVRCAPKNVTIFEECKTLNETYVPSEAVLRVKNINYPIWSPYLILMAFMVVIRTLGYIVLRFLRKPK